MKFIMLTDKDEDRVIVDCSRIVLVQTSQSDEFIDNGAVIWYKVDNAVEYLEIVVNEFPDEILALING